MDRPRKIETVWKSQPTIEGAGVHLRRAFGFYQVPRLDPFLLLDDFKNDDPSQYLPGFPWHPHRGIETITYVLQGEVAHGDSMGNKGVIRSGDVQWMTAGSGIIHQEMPKGDPAGKQWGFQLWANLPRSHKMMDPRYREVLAAQIPEVRRDGTVVKVVCGEVDRTAGPVQDIVTQPQYLDVSVPPHTVFRQSFRPSHTVFAYVIEGRAYFDRDRDSYAHDMKGQGWWDVRRECMPEARCLVLFERRGDFVEVRTEGEGARFLLVSGRPINEPVAWYGPIVMNTSEELKTAFAEFEQGSFIKRGQTAPS